jgi:hypothetical protein
MQLNIIIFFRLSLFAKAYKPVFKKNPKALKSIFEQLNQQMEKDITVSQIVSIPYLSLTSNTSHNV